MTNNADLAAGNNITSTFIHVQGNRVYMAVYVCMYGTLYKVKSRSKSNFFIVPEIHGHVYLVGFYLTTDQICHACHIQLFSYKGLFLV